MVGNTNLPATPPPPLPPASLPASLNSGQTTNIHSIIKWMCARKEKSILTIFDTVINHVYDLELATLIPGNRVPSNQLLLALSFIPFPKVSVPSDIRYHLLYPLLKNVRLRFRIHLLCTRNIRSDTRCSRCAKIETPVTPITANAPTTSQTQAMPYIPHPSRPSTF